MNRIAQLDPKAVTGKTKQLFDAVQSKMGVVPNLMRVLGNAPAALEGYLNFSGALAQGSFDGKLREQIALTVAEANLCSYCLSAHSFIGSRLGMSVGDIDSARNASASVAKNDAVLKLARSIVLQRGEISDSDVSVARAAGLGDGDIMETVANVALNILTNYVNHVARTVVDFPAVVPGATQQVAGARA